MTAELTLPFVLYKKIDLKTQGKSVSDYPLFLLRHTDFDYRNCSLFQIFEGRDFVRNFRVNESKF